MSLFDWTGNPFVDSGISAILVYSNKDSPEKIDSDDLFRMKELLSGLFVKERWIKVLNVVFTSNTHVTHNSAKTIDKKRERLNSYLKTLLEDITERQYSGDCIACGARNTVLQKNRTAIPLTGYGHSHFFPSLAAGADYCNLCSLAVQCAPLVMYSCGAKIAMFHSNSVKVMKVWAKRAFNFIQQQIASNSYKGCFNEGYKNPENALFHITQDLILSYEERWKEQNVTLRLYHFTNFTQLPSNPLGIYDLPAPVFRFLAEIRSHSNYQNWLRIIKRGYYKIENKTEGEYRNYNNEVYKRLLRSQSILNYFFDSTKKQVFSNWTLLTIYLKEILFMQNERIETIKKFADRIVAMIKQNSNGKKRLAQLEQAKNYASFRNVILRLVHDNIIAKNEIPLINFDDYVDSLFPDGALGWKETQDLILFRLYEQLHSWLIQEGIIIEEPEEEILTENN